MDCIAISLSTCTLSYRNTIYTPKSTFAQLPRVTVQLPMFNEHSVAGAASSGRRARLITRWIRLEIQVLDDSTDESADIARLACVSNGQP